MKCLYCDCTDSDSDGLCDEIENGTVDAWALSDIDFYNMTIDDFTMENYNPIKPQLKLELGI